MGWILTILALLLGYQVMFRYEHWMDPETHRMLERDNLSGHVAYVDANRPTHWLDRLLGTETMSLRKHKGDASRRESPLRASIESLNSKLRGSNNRDEATSGEAIALHSHRTSEDYVSNGMTGRQAPQSAAQERTPLPESPAIAAMAIPEPEYQEGHFDVNHDGVPETVIETPVNPKLGMNGPQEISVVAHGKEVFYGQGKSLKPLSSKTNGWTDLLLVVNSRQQIRYTYNSNMDQYKQVP